MAAPNNSVKQDDSPAEVVNFGCRLNTLESAAIEDIATQQGLKNTIIFNTCAVTAEAERQARQAIRKARRENPKHKIIVTGCAAQINPTAYNDMVEVDQVMGNREKLDAASFQQQDALIISDIMQPPVTPLEETAEHLITTNSDNRARAFVEIQTGCDHRCTFCIIPFGRGNSQSLPIGAVVERVKTLVANGHNEVVITGVDITGYGGDLPGKPRLGQLLRRLLNQVPELPRLRLSSVDPAEIDEEVFDLLANEPRLMPHLHISLQAGDDMVLKRMKRRHLRQDVIRFCEKVRHARPDAVFGCDIIAGFPTETDEMFANSVQLIEQCNITYLHVFPYSPRPGTPAAKMPQVDKPTIKRRAAILRELGQKHQVPYYQAQIGKTVPVIVEQGNIGRSPHFVPVQLVNADELATGSLAMATITNSSTHGVTGHI